MSQFVNFARASARSARVAAAAGRTTFVRAATSTAVRKAAATGGAAALTLGAGFVGSSYCAWSFWGKSEVDYQQVYKDIAAILDNIDYDDGSYGPVLVRLAWHASGTYNKADGSGGSNFATMRFEPESMHGANAGLKLARDLLEPIKKKYPEISYGDLWTLAGVVAIQEAGGPVVPWRPGRTDGVAANCTPDGRLPDASKASDHIRAIFYRMGFNDQEIVALAGAHALGRCHTDRSGFVGPWTRAPTTFSNEYFTRLVEEKWVEKKTHTGANGKTEKWTGPKQYVDAKTGDIMMLPSDVALIDDAAFKAQVELYAKDKTKFFNDFSAAFARLMELGVPFKADTKVFNFTK